MIKFRKKSSRLFEMILFIMFVNIRKSQAQVLDNSINHRIRNPRPDDNLIIGDNIRDRVQENGRTAIHADGRDYVYYRNNNENPGYEGPVGGKNLIEQNFDNDYNNRKLVQINGDTDIHYGSKPRLPNGRNKDIPYVRRDHIPYWHASEGLDPNIRYPKNNHNIVPGNNLENQVKLNRDPNLHYDNRDFLPKWHNNENLEPIYNENEHHSFNGNNRKRLLVNNMHHKQNDYMDHIPNWTVKENYLAYDNDQSITNPKQNFLRINKNGNHVQLQNNKGGGNGKTFGQNNIISGNNIRNRVQINGETIEEGQIGDDVAKLNNHNMNHDHRVKEKGNRDRVNSHNDHNNDRKRVQVNAKTIEQGTIGDKQSSKQLKETIVTTTEEPSLWQKTKNWFG